MLRPLQRRQCTIDAPAATVPAHPVQPAGGKSRNVFISKDFCMNSTTRHEVSVTETSSCVWVCQGSSGMSHDETLIIRKVGGKSQSVYTPRLRNPKSTPLNLTWSSASRPACINLTSDCTFCDLILTGSLHFLVTKRVIFHSLWKWW